jgi:putative ABC transport system permease protein
MIGHYLRSALSKFLVAPFATCAGILTLALGLACFIAAWSVVIWWRSGDSYHPDADRIVVIGHSQTKAGEASDGLSSSSNENLAPYLRLDFPELAPIARAMPQTDVAVAAGARKSLLNVASVDPEFLKIFSFDFVEGSAATALAQPDTVVLTREAATRLFDGPALGQRVLINSDLEAVVTGVIAPVRQPSFMGAKAEAVLRFDMLRAWHDVPGSPTRDQWRGMGPKTFAVLPLSLSLAQLNARLPGFVEHRIPVDQQRAVRHELRAFPISEMTTHELDRALFARASTEVSAISVLVGLGALTLLVACLNYANLATAQAVGRAREIGLRKTLGASRASIVFQVWLDAALLTSIALLVALAALALAAPVIETRQGIKVLHALATDWRALPGLVALGAVVSLAAAIYPALVLSGLRPVVALRSARLRSGSGATARLLVGLQFASASFLLILVSVAHLQRVFLEQTALAPRSDPIIILNDLMPLDVDFETLRSRLVGRRGIQSVSVVDRAPWNLNGENVIAYGRTLDAGTGAPTAYLKSIGIDYFDALQLPVVAGRAFDALRDTPASPYAFARGPYNIVIDRIYAKRLGFGSLKEAVGTQLYLSGDRAQANRPPPPPATIIGVSESEVTRLEVESAEGHVYAYLPRAFFGGQHPIVRLSRGDVAGGVESITTAWDGLAPSIPANIRFFDDLFEQGFRTYGRISQFILLLSVSAFLIATLGLIGIAVHVTAGRRREIGVRKTLGATTSRVLRMLIADFSTPVIAGNLAAWPIAWLAAQAYLQTFAHRTPLTLLPFLASLGITLLIAWLSVGSQAWRAAGLKPALVLRAE